MALILGSGLVLSTCFACATPFAALATVAALKLRRREAAGVVGLVWLINQAAGFGMLDYPWTWACAAWGIAIGLSCGLAGVSAWALASEKPTPLAVSLPFVAAFAMFESGLYVAGYALPGSDGAFSGSVILHVFLINAVSLSALMAVHPMVMILGRWARPAAVLPGASGSLR